MQRECKGETIDENWTLLVKKTSIFGYQKYWVFFLGGGIVLHEILEMLFKLLKQRIMKRDYKPVGKKSGVWP